jgi:GNAT superfamily N-acetyltransferase
MKLAAQHRHPLPPDPIELSAQLDDVWQDERYTPRERRRTICLVRRGVLTEGDLLVHSGNVPVAPFAIMIRQASPAEIDEFVAIDNDACTLYAQAGLEVDLGPEHPYSRAERAYWTRAATDGGAFLAEQPGVGSVGLLVMDLVDGAPYLEQLSVRTGAMRRGLGRRLLAHAIAWAGDRPLWLTTYAHLPYNRPFYESAGFTVVPESQCPPGIVALLEDQRRWLPAPEQRVALCRVHGAYDRLVTFVARILVFYEGRAGCWGNRNLGCSNMQAK